MAPTQPLPPWNDEGFLPPGLPPSWQSSPYAATLPQLVARFGHTPHRRRLIEGLLAYRAELRALGFQRGFQWIAGSFTDDVERIEGRPPADIDLVSFLHAPPGLDDHAFDLLVQRHPALHDRPACKARYHCDPYLLPLQPGPLVLTPEAHVARIAHWTLLYGTHRLTGKTKGLVRLDFETVDGDEEGWEAVRAKEA